MSSIDLKNTTIRMRDGTIPTPNYIEIQIGEGNLTWNEKREIHFVKSRGDLNQVRIGDDIEMDVSFAFLWDFITGSDTDPPTVEDVLKHRRTASTWLSASADPDAPFSVNIDLLYTPLCSGIKKEDYIFPEFNYTALSHNIKDGSIDCQGQCNFSQALVSRIS